MTTPKLCTWCALTTRPAPSLGLALMPARSRPRCARLRWSSRRKRRWMPGYNGWRRLSAKRCSRSRSVGSVGCCGVSAVSSTCFGAASRIVGRRWKPTPLQTGRRGRRRRFRRCTAFGTPLGSAATCSTAPTDASRIDLKRATQWRWSTGGSPSSSSPTTQGS